MIIVILFVHREPLPYYWILVDLRITEMASLCYIKRKKSGLRNKFLKPDFLLSAGLMSQPLNYIFTNIIYLKRATNGWPRPYNRLNQIFRTTIRVGIIGLIAFFHNLIDLRIFTWISCFNWNLHVRLSSFRELKNLDFAIINSKDNFRMRVIYGS